MLDYPCGRVIYAVNAGLYAAAASLLGKLSGIQDHSTCVSTIVYFSTTDILTETGNIFLCPILITVKEIVTEFSANKS
jgi:hypothetical protein